MPEPIDSVRRRGGAVATHELYAAGMTKRQIATAVAAGTILRARQGWFVEPRIHQDLIRAARVGGRLTCRSALRLRGVWVPPDSRLHVVVDPNDCELRSPDDRLRRLAARDDTTVHWRDDASGSRVLTDLVGALEDLARCASPDLLAASADSALRVEPGIRSSLAVMAGRLPRDHRRALAAADGICESGTETIFWRRMRRFGVRRQVAIPDVGRIDFLIGDRLVVEIDGEAFHSEPRAFENDRRRDALLSSRGCRVLRFSYRQVMHRWSEVESAVLAAIARGDLH